MTFVDVVYIRLSNFSPTFVTQTRLYT